MVIDYGQKVPSVPLPPGFVLHSAASRPGLTQIIFDPNHPLIRLWPKFITMSDSNAQWGPIVYETPYFAQFQLFLVKQGPGEEETVVARSDSLPLFCPPISERKSYKLLEIPGSSVSLTVNSCVDYELPSGAESVVETSVQQYQSRQRGGQPPRTLESRQALTGHTATSPNILSALQVAVDPQYRGQGLAEIMIQAMKVLATQEGLNALVVPLRPTRKADYPMTDFAEYLRWKVTPHGKDEPFDPWLRKHVRLGGRPLQIAYPSMSVRAGGEQWSEWTGQDLAARARALVEKLDSDTDYVEIPIPGGLAPLRYYPKQDYGVYDEPNVWLIHSLD